MTRTTDRSGTPGLHHITAISGPAQENLDFYAGVLGMRLVKKSVNQDDPGTYHLFYADAEGRPGTDLTFFPWQRMARARLGHGLATEVGLAVAPGSLEYWAERFERYGVPVGSIAQRFGERVLPFVDPHGLNLVLTESESAAIRPFTPWEGSTVPPQAQIRGLDGARMTLRSRTATEELLSRTMGLERLAEEGGAVRWGRRDSAKQESAGSGTRLDLVERPELPRGAWGTGAVHHLAWRVDDLDHELELRSAIDQAGHRPTPVIDRFWFRSVYFKEPGGVLFELATDGPGFAVDEAPGHLGESLVLPPWLESERPAIESALPVLAPASADRSRK